jgi:hypothetical protein
VSSTCFEQRSLHPQEDLYVQFYGIFFLNSSLVDVHQTAYSYKVSRKTCKLFNIYYGTLEGYVDRQLRHCIQVSVQLFPVTDLILAAYRLRAFFLPSKYKISFCVLRSFTRISI